MNKIYLFCFLFFISFCAHASAQTQNRQFDSIARKIDEISNYQNTQTKVLIDSLYQIAHRSPDSLRLIAHCLCKEAKWSSDQGILDDELPIRIEQHAKKLESTAFSLEKALLQYAFGQCRLASGEYATAFEINLQALDLFKMLGDSAYISRSLQALASVNADIRMIELSREYFREALLWVPKNSKEYYKILYNIYLLYAFEGNMETLIDSMQYLITLIPEKERSSFGLLIPVYTSLATAYKNMDQMETGGNYFNKVEQQISHIDNPYLQSAFYNNFGSYMKKKKDYKKALEYFTIARQLDEQDNNIVRSYSTYSNLATLFEILGEKDSALFYLKKKDQVSKKIIANNRAIEVYQQYISNYLKLTESQLAVAEQATLLQKRRNMIFSILSVFIIMMLLFILILVNQQRRRKKTEANFHRAEAETEREKARAADQRRYYQKRIDKLEKERQQEAISAKERELASSSLLISNKNDMLRKISKLTEKLREEENNAPHLAEEIDEIIHQELQMNDAWGNFILHFEQVNPDFFVKLKRLAPRLSEENLKMCAYIRMGLSSREVSILLGINLQSVYNQRNRIKKRLGLPEEDDLDAFLKEV